ncbi:hypothetical protein ACOSQ2_027261 [Xanthoceras sorbifolium]
MNASLDAVFSSREVRITQGDYDGKGVIISWVTPDEPGSNKVQYGKSENKYDFSAEGMVTNYTFYNYKSGYIHHCLVDDLETSDSFSGPLLFAVEFLLFMVAFVKDREFQSFFAKGCVILHVSMAVWRVGFERKLDDLAHDWPKHVVGDFALAPSWVLFLVYSWREKYD